MVFVAVCHRKIKIIYLLIYKHNLYIGVIIFYHMNNTGWIYSSQLTSGKVNKKLTQKMKTSIKLMCHWRWQFSISLQYI